MLGVFIHTRQKAGFDPLVFVMLRVGLCWGLCICSISEIEEVTYAATDFINCGAAARYDAAGENDIYERK